MGSSLPLQGGTVLAKTVSETHAQAAHGFSIGDVVRYSATLNPPRWIKAQANNAENAEVAGVISAVPSTTTFTVVYSGFIDLPAPFAGVSFPALFLSDSTAGGLTASPPSAIGSVVKPVAIRSSNGSGHLVVNYMGTQIGGSSTVAIDQVQPVGTIMPYAGTVIPDTWLECSGASYGISDYPELYDRLLYSDGSRAPLYGHVATLGFASAFGSVGQILTQGTGTALVRGRIIAVSGTTVTVQTLPVYNNTTRSFVYNNAVFGTGTVTVEGTSTTSTITTISITHFNAPDLRGRFAIGVNGTAVADNTTESDNTFVSSIGLYPVASMGGEERNSLSPISVATSGSTNNALASVTNNLLNNIPPYVATRYIIKAKPYTRAAIIDELEINYPNLLVNDLRSGLMRGAGVGEDVVFKTNTSLSTTGTERMRLTNSGSIGISGSPQSKFHVYGDEKNHTAANSGVVVVANQNNSVQVNIGISPSGGVTGAFIEGWRPGIGGATLTIQPSGGNTIILGNVGIGTNSPTAKLQVFGTNGEQSEVRITSTTANSGGRLTLYENTQGAHAIISQGANRNLTIQDLFYQVPMVSINNANNSGTRVGIGTTTPTTTLDVNGSVAFSGNLYTTAGRIGVGTSTPTVPLDVVGTSRFSGGVGTGIVEMKADSTYPLKVTGKIFASDDIVAFSDARQKRDIAPITDALHKVRSLVGVLYTDTTDQRKTGLLAQDVQAVLPEAVTTDENGNLALAYGNLAGILVQAIKELSMKVDELEKR